MGVLVSAQSGHLCDDLAVWTYSQIGLNCSSPSHQKRGFLAVAEISLPRL